MTDASEAHATRMEPEAFLEARAIVKRFPGALACDHVDLALRPGEVVGLVGKNGAGKTTLIKIFAGAEIPDEGEIFLDGEAVDLRDPHHANSLGLSFLHQELSDVPNLSVAENVELGLGYPRRFGIFVNWRQLRRQSREVLDRLEADIDPRTPVGALSIAQQRLVTIARALAQRARLVVLDEPTASLTEDEIEHLHAVIRSLREDGVAVIYVSHRLDEIFEISDRAVVMRDGRVVADAPIGDLDRHELIGHITGTSESEGEPERRKARVGGAAKAEELLRVEGVTQPGAVEDVSFEIHAGELLGIAGLVGAGRTELARLVFGADRLAAGKIFVRGREVGISSPTDALREGIVLLPEDRRREGTVQSFNIRENITLTTLPNYRAVPSLPLPSKRAEQRSARALMEQLSIVAPDAEHPVKWLSGGNQQKVVLAKWLERGADVFIFDEPTHGIDVEGKEEIYRLMEELAADGKGVIFISSEFAELVIACHRVIVMREGRLVDELEGDAITEAAIVERCYAAT